MGIRTRGLDIKVGAKQRAADKAARAEAKAVVERWNEQLAADRELLWSPTIRAALIGARRGSTCSASVTGLPQPRSLSPDRLPQFPFAPTGPGTLSLQTLTDRYTVGGATRRSSAHASDMLVAYLPQSKILVNADLYSPPRWLLKTSGCVGTEVGALT